MEKFDLVDVEQWLLPVGSDHPFFRINTHTVFYTWVCLGIITAFLLVGRYFLTKKSGMGRFITLSIVEFFIDLVRQSLPTFSVSNLVFIATTFCFILACNLISIIPWMEEPTTDLNTTIGLGLCSFFYTQVSAIQALGIKEYIHGYFTPFFIMFPMHVVGKLATVISISFRLFGNIFGGSIISTIYFGSINGSLFMEIFGLFSGINLIIFMFFGIFEGFLQAFVFSMLSLTYLSLALQGEEH